MRHVEGQFREISCDSRLQSCDKGFQNIRARTVRIGRRAGLLASNLDIKLRPGGILERLQLHRLERSVTVL